MNTIDELMGNGISRGTAEKMLCDYERLIGSRSGVYEVEDIDYDFHSRGKVVKLKCTECGRKLSRLMISGRNKWSELIKTCPCEKKKKAAEQETILKNLKKQKRGFARERVGKAYGDYVISEMDSDGCEYTLRCLVCGNEIKIPVSTFERRKNFKCKKHYSPKIKFDESYVGKKNNYLTVISLARFPKSNHKAFLCECDCGNVKMIEPFMWENGIIKSCGCYAADSKLEHSPELDRLRRIYGGMIQRCYNKNAVAYKNYGGRGISICDEWIEDREKFIKWALQNGYKNDLSIDRIDVNGNYEPNNCRWADWDVQANNKRPKEEWKERERIIEYKENKYYLRELCSKFNTSPTAVRYRMKHMGMSFEEALETPKKQMGRPRKVVK